MFVQDAVHVVVLTGGRSSRMGGRHKPGILVDGRSVIDRTVSTVWSAFPSAHVVIAGTASGLSETFRPKITLVREEPPFAGPLAGVAAAAATLPPSAGRVLLLGGDLPFLSAETLTGLLDAVRDGADAASCLDATGHMQYLCSSWRQDVLQHQVNQVADPTNVPLRALFAGLEPTLIECDPDELRDIDTPEDLARAVTTSDGRPVPESLLAAVEHFDAGHGVETAGLSPQQIVEILEFAYNVKYSPSAANPAVAAFLAGQVAGSAGDGSVLDALRRVLDVVYEPGQLGDL